MVVGSSRRSNSSGAGGRKTASAAAAAARQSVQEMHIAVLGMNGSGKSALTVKYITRRFITEYDPSLEDTYCKHEMIRNQEYMLWIMDTVEGNTAFFIRFSAEYEGVVKVYGVVDMFCEEIETSNDTRQVSKTQGARLAEEMKAQFFELNTTEEYALVKTIFHHAIHAANMDVQQSAALKCRSPSPNKSGYGASDSEGASTSSAVAHPPALPTRRSNSKPSPKRSLPSSSAINRRSKSPAAMFHDQVKHTMSSTMNNNNNNNNNNWNNHSSATDGLPPLKPQHSQSASLPVPLQSAPATKKTSTGIKLFKIFNN